MTQHAKDPRALLRRIIEEHPEATEQEWRDMFYAEVKDDPGYLRAIAKDVFDDLQRPKAN